ncbi:MAG: hypothetical protein ABIP94_13990 [Planctomycetota bacterium]
MTSKGDKTEQQSATGADSVPRLLRDLAERERQLRDLTEQSLGFLEELAESRRLNADREQIAQRLGQLEHMLGETQRRLRHAGGVVQAPSEGASPTSREGLEVVFWGGEAWADAVASCADRGRVPVLWVGGADALPSKSKAKRQGKAGTKSAAKPEGDPSANPADAFGNSPQVIAHRDARTSAQCWNLGMAATSADYVLFVGPGLQLRTEPKLPTAVPPNAALLCPRIVRGKRSELGCEELQLLRLRPCEAASTDAVEPTKVDWPSAESFLVRRAAFERIGLFDEGLLGSAALLDFTLRSRRSNFEVLGAPGLAVVGSGESVGAATPQDDEQRLLVLAAHRPEALGLALADMPLLWQMEPGALSGYLAQLLSRVRSDDGNAPQRAVLEQIALGLVRHALPVAQVCARVRESRLALLRGLADVDLPTGREEVVASLGRAEQHEFREPVGAFAVLLEDMAQNRRVVGSAVQVLQQQLQQAHAQTREIDEQRHAQLARAERADGVIRTVQTQLDQVQVWLREAHARLEASGEQQVRLDLRLQEEARGRERVERELATSRVALDERQRELQEAKQQRQEALRELQEGQRQTAATRSQYRELEAEFLATDAGLRELRDEVSAMARLMGLASTERGEKLQLRLAQLHEESVRFAETLRVAGAPDSQALLKSLDALAQRLQGAEQTVVERDGWIALLLEEVQKRRVFPRKLLAHEQALLDRAARKP